MAIKKIPLGQSAAHYNTEADLLTTVNTFVAVATVPVAQFQTKHFQFTGATNTLSVKILGSIDGTTFPFTEVAAFDVAAAATVTKTFTTPYLAVQVQVQPKVGGAHGTLSTWWFLGGAW